MFSACLVLVFLVCDVTTSGGPCEDGVDVYCSQGLMRRSAAPKLLSSGLILNHLCQTPSIPSHILHRLRNHAQDACFEQFLCSSQTQLVVLHSQTQLVVLHANFWRQRTSQMYWHFTQNQLLTRSRQKSKGPAMFRHQLSDAMKTRVAQGSCIVRGMHAAWPEQPWNAFVRVATIPSLF